VNAGDYAKTLLATVTTVAVLVLMMWALGKQYSKSLNSQIDLKLEILRRLGGRR
jgi:hypothetical protein